MTSNINPLMPTSGTATTASVRNNFAAAKGEIEQLQEDLNGVGGALIAAESAANSASMSAQNAGTAAGSATGSANAAANSASEAGGYSISAGQSAAAAAQSASDAAQSASDAAASGGGGNSGPIMFKQVVTIPQDQYQLNVTADQTGTFFICESGWAPNGVYLPETPDDGLVFGFSVGDGYYLSINPGQTVDPRSQFILDGQDSPQDTITLSTKGATIILASQGGNWIILTQTFNAMPSVLDGDNYWSGPNYFGVPITFFRNVLAVPSSAGSQSEMTGSSQSVVVPTVTGGTYTMMRGMTPIGKELTLVNTLNGPWTIIPAAGGSPATIFSDEGGAVPITSIVMNGQYTYIRLFALTATTWVVLDRSKTGIVIT